MTTPKNTQSQQSSNPTNRYLSDKELGKPSQEIGQEISRATKNTLDHLTKKKFSEIEKSHYDRESKAKYFKLTSNKQSTDPNIKISQKIIKVQEVQQDPLAPKEFKQRKAPRQTNSPPKTILHSPPRKLTAKDQEDWEIPPCVSNFVNPKSLTIPLDKRVLADGRNFNQNVTVNERFAKHASVLYIGEREAKKEITERNRLRDLEVRKKIIKEESRMREAADLARQEKSKIMQELKEQSESGNLNKRTSPYVLEAEEGKAERDQMRYIRRREIERERKIEVSGRRKSRESRDRERDISEKIALGQAQSAFSKGEMFDQRLFNQTSGLDSGFGDEDSYSIYDKPLRAERSGVASIYDYSGQKDVSRKPARGFEGAQGKGRQNKPIEFEKHM